MILDEKTISKIAYNMIHSYYGKEKGFTQKENPKSCNYVFEAIEKAHEESDYYAYGRECVSFDSVHRILVERQRKENFMPGILTRQTSQKFGL